MGRARRMLVGLSGVAAARGPFGSAVRFCLGLALFAWAIEIAFALTSTPLLNAGRARGLLAGLGLSCLVAIAAGAAAGGISKLFGGGGDGGGAVSPSARVARWLWERDASVQRPRIGTVLGGVGLLVPFCATAFVITRALVLGMAQPHFAATAIVAAHLVLFAVAAACFPVARRAGTRIASGIARLPGAGRPAVFRAGVLLGALAGLAAVLAAAVLIAFWTQTFSLLPWRTICVAAGALLLSACAGPVAARLPALVQTVLRSLRAVLVGVALLALATLDARGEASRRAVHETWNGRIGQLVALRVLDFDRDGSLHVFGGGDCAPFDPRVGPLMVDIPNNGRDEDCDGADLDEKQLGVELRRNFPVPPEFPKRPPIVLITIDTFAATRMRALGYERAVTPRLDAFAKRSVLFRYGFAQGPSTRLSFPALFTSRWDSQIEQKLVGSHPYPIAESEVMLAEVLSGEGYDTVAVIPDAYFKKSRWGSLTSGFKQVIDSPIRKSVGRHNSAAVTDAAIAALRKARKKPLFLWVHYYDAHSPHDQPPGEPRLGTTRADVYDAELRLVDREVGRLLDALEAQPPKPLIFVTGDHGIAFDAPRHTRFNYGYDLSTAVLHVPLIVHGPSISPGVMDGVVSTMDIAPTIANLLRIKRRLPFEGASLVPELLDNKRVRPERLLHQFYLEERLWNDAEPLEQVALRTDRYNLIHNRVTGAYELYDWRSDYYEKHDLADAAEHRNTLLGLRKQLALLTYRVYGRERSRAANLTRGATP